MSYRFHTRHINTPLFGAIAGADDAAKEPWRQDFAAGTDSSIWIDDLALDWLANELELDHEALAWDAQRYVQGEYRPKAEGMSGGRLGELGEALTYLAERGAGRHIVRVLGADTGGKVMLKGHTYCYPDFIVQHGHTLQALEVKSTEALNHQAMVRKLDQHRHNARFHMNLAPCQGAEAGREAALAQLGYGGQAPGHGLKLLGGTSVPYPVNQGVAMSVIAVDGRVRPHWGQSAFKTPRSCRDQSRSCVGCIGAAQVVMTRMPNAPEHLPLLGQGEGDVSPWFKAHERWTQALMCHDAIATRHATEALLGPLRDWIASLGEVQQAAAVNFWDAHLRQAVSQRGLDVDAIAPMLQVLPNLKPKSPNATIDEQDEQPSGRYADLRGEMLSADDFIARLDDILHSDHGSWMLFSQDVEQAPDRPPAATWTVRVQPHRLDVFMMSRQWWRREEVETEFQAGALVSKVLFFLSQALGDLGQQLNSTDVELDVHRVAAEMGEEGEHSVTLGWMWQGDASYFARHWWWHHSAVPPTCRVRVTPDGRVQLTLHRHAPA